MHDVIAPQRKERVETVDRTGVFEVVGVNSIKRTVKLRAVDASRPVIPNVPWTSLKPMSTL